MLTRSERLELLDGDQRELPLKTQAELLDLNRSGLYYRPVPPSPEDLALKRAIDEIFTERPYYGSRRITVVLRRRGWEVNRKAVQRQMRQMGLEAIYPGPNLSRRHQDHRVYPYLLRGMIIDAPNQVWGTDITYIRLARGWLYLVAVLDWYSRYVVSWALSDTLEAAFVVAAIDEGFEQAIPQILNSDQGSQYTSPAYLELVQAAGVRISMDGRGRALDNVFTERLWRSLKYEEVYLNEYDSPRHARLSIAEYFGFYNHDRPHQALDDRTPAELYASTKVPPAWSHAVIHRPSPEGGMSSLNLPHIVS